MNVEAVDVRHSRRCLRRDMLIGIGIIALCIILIIALGVYFGLNDSPPNAPQGPRPTTQNYTTTTLVTSSSTNNNKIAMAADLKSYRIGRHKANMIS